MGNKQYSTENLVVLLHLEDLKKIQLIVEQKIKTEKDFDINAKLNQFGDTALHYATYKSNAKIVSYLVKKGADHTIKNTRGISPADLAREADDIELINIFEKKRGGSPEEDEEIQPSEPQNEVPEFGNQDNEGEEEDKQGDNEEEEEKV